MNILPSFSYTLPGKVRLFRLITEKQHLTFCQFEEIAVDLHYCIRTVQRMHAKALEVVQGILDGE